MGRHNGSPGPPDRKLCEIRNGSVRCHPEMSGVDRGDFGLHKDGKGNLWVGLETGVWRWRPGPPQFYAVPGCRTEECRAWRMVRMALS